MGILRSAMRDREYLVWSGALLFILGISLLVLSQTGGADADGTPVAVVSPTPAATATPSGPTPEQVMLDARRLLDLDTVAKALETYRTQHGAYPSTENNPMTLCASGFDPGCLLLAIAPKLPATDGFRPYWYRSDGASYTLYTRIETPDPAHVCSDEPLALGGGSVYCLKKQGAAP